MKRAATTLAASLVIALVVVACASMQPKTSELVGELVGRAVQAQGGAEAPGPIKPLSETATLLRGEPVRAMAPHG